MYCVRPLLKRRSEEAVPEHLLGVGQRGPASLGCWQGYCKSVPVTCMLPHAADVWCPRSRLHGFPGVGSQAWKSYKVLLHLLATAGIHKATMAALAVLPQPGPQLCKSAFLHRGAGLNDPRWGVVFAGWMVSLCMYVYLAFGTCMRVYISTYIQVKAENSLKIQA